ncbi:MAG: DUF3866 family protein [Actinomycetota bacterium]|nr:DUF3866 family protein [Actinomycetota bacterium]
MPAFREGKVITVTLERRLLRARVALPSGDCDAVGFPEMLGSVEAGDRVVLNTTGVDLGLGTGGVAFIVWNLDGTTPTVDLDGHIVKLRYTPWQREALSVEEPDSPHHEKLAAITSIDGMPVVACTLHSQVAGVAAGIKATAPDKRVGYLMTDGASLPLAWSDLVVDLKEKSFVDVTASCGHAFGGDLEAVNVFSGLAALRHAADCDVAIVAMGPGVVGTGTALGHTALEQGQIIDATNALAGRAIACLRITFADERPRHQGVSHHTITALRLVAQTRATVVVPTLEESHATTVRRQLDGAGIAGRHDVVTADGAPGVRALETAGLRPASMGRPFESVRELFLAAAAAGAVAAKA